MDEKRRVVAKSRSGPSNPMRVGFDSASAAVCEAARLAILSAGVPRQNVVSLCAGLAGAAHPESAQKMANLLEKEFPDIRVRVCTDLDLTLESAGNGAAIVLIAGTGSAAVGRDANGHNGRVGGHGYLLGDTGSAYHVGQQAVAGALRHFERTGADMPLGQRILAYTGAPTWAELQARINAAPDEVLPRLFPVVLQAAETGEATARTLLEDCARALAEQVKDLAERLLLQTQKFLLVKTGGMLGRSPYFDERMDFHLRKAVPMAQFGELQWSPAETAARLALRHLPPV